MKVTKKSILSVFVWASMTTCTMAQNFVKVQFVEGLGSGREGAQFVADGRKATKWCYDAPEKMPYYVVVEASEAFKLKEYVLVTGDDTYTYPERNPATWMVYGSNDKKDWKLLDERHSNFRMADLNEQEYYFPVKDASAFKFYKFLFMEMQDETRIQLSEIMLVK